MTIYLHIDGSFWKLTPAECRKFIADALVGIVDTSQLTSLQRRPHTIFIDDGRLVLSKDTGEHALIDASRFDRDDWYSAAYQFGVLKHQGRKPLVEVEPNVYVSPRMQRLSREDKLWVLRSMGGDLVDSGDYFNDLVEKHEVEVLHRF